MNHVSPRLLTEGEDELIGRLGIYGCWLCKHARRLPRHEPLRNALRYEFGMYACPYDRDHDATRLMNLIDRVIVELRCEPLIQNYPLALQDLLTTRRQARGTEHDTAGPDDPHPGRTAEEGGGEGGRDQNHTD